MSTGMVAVDQYLLWRVVGVATDVVFEMSWRHISNRRRQRLQVGFVVCSCHPVGVKMLKIIRLACLEVRR